MEFENTLPNFDVVVRDSFHVVTVVISDSLGNIILAATQKLLVTNPLIGEASTTLLASQLALSTGIDSFFGARMMLFL